MPPRKYTSVSIKPHAVKQYLARGGLSPPSEGEIRAKLLGALRAGAEFTACSVKIKLWDGFIAVCVPEFWGGWSVVTIYREGEQMKDVLICPRCGGEAHEVFFGDGVRRWRCMECDSIYSETTWIKNGNELVRRRSYGIQSVKV